MWLPMCPYFHIAGDKPQGVMLSGSNSNKRNNNGKTRVGNKSNKANPH